MITPTLHYVREKAQLMSASQIERTLLRLAQQTVEKNNGVEHLALIGIRRRGVPLAERLAARTRQVEQTEVPVGKMDITLYRDDLSTVGPKPQHKPSDRN